MRKSAELIKNISIGYIMRCRSINYNAFYTPKTRGCVNHIYIPGIDQTE